MENAEAVAYIGRWEPSSVSAEGAAFARDVVAKTAPESRDRAKSLLWAAGKLADYAVPLGLEAVPEVLLHPSAVERFTRCAPGLSPAARRTLRTNLRFIGRRVVPHLYPADLPLPRERAKKPYGPAEIAGFLALADAQPTLERRMRAAGLICCLPTLWVSTAGPACVVNGVVRGDSGGSRDAGWWTASPWRCKRWQRPSP